MFGFDIVPLIQLVGYPGLFGIIFLESGVFFGFFLPGISILFASGILASQGYFNIWLLVPLLTAAAILGDLVGYWFGKHVGYRLFLRPDSRFFKHEYLERTKRFYEVHGAKAIVLARFIPILRTFAPIVAGVAEMNFGKFLFYNVIGGIIWAAGATLLGFYLGSKVPILEHYLEYIVIAIILIPGIPVLRELFRKRDPYPTV